MDYSSFITEIANLRKPSPLRDLGNRFMTNPGKNYPLSGGLPSPDVFIFKEATFVKKDGQTLRIDEDLMRIGQQYNVTEGYAPLLEIWRYFQTKLHNPPSKNWSVMATAGGQEALCRAIELVVGAGDFVVGGDHCYCGALAVIEPIGAKYIEVEQDIYGIRPDSLRKVLSEWYASNGSNKTGGRPKIIYMVPNGGNPESRTLALDRRQEIYKIAQEFNLLIVEDDPYQFIVFDKKDLPASFVSLDVDGRVIRCDSISKTICPGFRLGFITAARPLLEKMVYHIQTSTAQPNSMTQVITYKLLSEWGFEGYVENAKRACQVYCKQKDIAVAYAKKYLGELVEMEEPSGGMFMWIRVKGVKDTTSICMKAADREAFFAPGSFFKYGQTPSSFIRVSFSLITEEILDNGFRILAEVIREELDLQNGHECNGIVKIL